MNDKTNLDRIVIDNNYNYINDLIISNIKKTVKNIFPSLNSNDVNYLFRLTCKTIDKICIKFNFQKESNYYNQWLQNNNQDIKAVILLHLPFLDSVKDDGKVFKSLTNLSNIIVNNNSNQLIKTDLKKTRQEMLKKELYYSNISIDLLDDSKDIILDSNQQIYSILYQKFLIINKTLDIVANKLYINWVNLQPLNLNNYKESKIFKETTENFIKIIDNPINISSIKENSSLDVSNYYGTIRNYIYNDLKKIKWMIYCRNIDMNNGYYFIQILGKMFDLKQILEKESYNILIDNDKLNFNVKYNSILKNLRSGSKIINDNSISFTLERDVLKAFFKFMVSNDNTNNFNDNVYNIFREKQENEELEDNERYQNISDSNLILALEKLEDKNVLWNFLKKSLLKLKYNYLGNLLFDDENNLINNFYYYPDTKFNLKNIYNYAKYLSYTNEEDRNILDPNYFNLELIDIEKFWIKISKNDYPNDRFNINRNLNIQFNNNIPNNFQNEIENQLRNKINEIVWNFLVFNGLVSQFVPRLNITNKKIKSQDPKFNEKLMKKIIDTDENRKSNYFLTNDKYEKLKIIDNNKEKTYFETLYKVTSWEKWYNFYAMNWLCQIDFFMHFIFLNDCFITGATGQGKSTQCPKLYAFACKSFNYKSNPVIICSQPRLDPTSGNTERISESMGVPIFYKKNNKKVNSNLYYLQYKHSANDHVMDNLEHPIIRMTTDGTLLTQINKNICCKKKYYNLKEKKWKLSNSNIFDVVLVDEAHEHNTNMDLILTSLKFTLKLNPKVKIGIISATMDDDEPIYRYFFKNKPLEWVTILNNNIIDLNSLYLDKRFHISPPGETTRYKIREFYSDTEDLKNQEINSIEKVKYICNISNKGQILLFSTGQTEIVSLIKKLNKILPSDIIALPYFSKMNEKYKDIVRNISKELPRLKNKKENVAEEWGDDFIEDNSVSNNIYKRAVIIATNVAEASITIPGLKFVIDNGYAKVNKYNVNSKTSILSVEEISEASRLQRKGRVGRIADGDVYYLYPKGGRENNLPKYKITQENIGLIMLKALVEDDDDINFCINEGKNLENLDLFDLNTSNKVVDKNGSYYIINPFEDKVQRNIIGKIIKEVVEKEEKGKIIKKILDNQKNMIPNFYYNQYIKLVLGKLFIVLNQKINIIESNEIDEEQIYNSFFKNYIVKTDDPSNKLTYNSILNKFQEFLTKSQDKKYNISNFTNQILKYLNEEEKFNDYMSNEENLYLNYIFSKVKFKEFNNISLLLNEYKEYDYIETQFHKVVKEVSGKLSKDYNQTITLLFSKGIGIFDDIVLILPFLNLLERTGLSNLALTIHENKKRKSLFNNLFSNYKKYNSDLLAIHKIAKNFKNRFYNLKFFKYINGDSKIEKKLKMNYNRKKEYFNLIYNKNKIYIKNKFISIEEFNIFTKLLTKENYDDEKSYKYYISQLNFLNKIFFDDFYKNKYEIKKWCDENYLNYELFFNYYEKLIDLYFKVNNYDLEINENLGEENYFEIFSNYKKFKFDTQRLVFKEKIELVFLLGYYDNLMIRNDDLSYVPFNSISNKYNILSDFNGKKTFVEYPSEIICCFNRLSRRSENYINLIFNVNEEFLGKYLTHKHNKKVFKLEYPIYSYDNVLKKKVIKKIIKFNSTSRNILYNKIYNSVSINNNLFFNEKFKYIFDGLKNLSKSL